jgi:hypothetical protein
MISANHIESTIYFLTEITYLGAVHRLLSYILLMGSSRLMSEEINYKGFEEAVSLR